MIMTSKEFLRRCEFFAVFEKAAKFFYIYEYLLYIYKVSCYGNCFSSESYVSSYKDVLSEIDNFPSSFDLVYIENFSRFQFNSQFKFFLSFLSRLSDRQMNILSSSGRFEYLLKFKDKFNSMKNTAVQDA